MRDPTRRYPELSRRGEKILMALLEHPSQEKAAAAAEVSAVTLWRWQQKPEFQKALLEARREYWYCARIPSPVTAVKGFSASNVYDRVVVESSLSAVH
jgi:hypothetical protein